MFRVVEFRAVFGLYHLDRGHLVSIAIDLGLSCGGTHFCASRTGCGAWFREITSSTLKLLVRLMVRKSSGAKMDLSLFARKFLCQPRADVRQNLFRRRFRR